MKSLVAPALPILAILFLVDCSFRFDNPAEQPLIDRFLAGGSEGELLSGQFWTDPYQDGRRSQAMLGLIRRVRELRASGEDVRIVSIDQFPPPDDRDEAMAEKLAALRARALGDRILVLVGNMHAKFSLRPAAHGLAIEEQEEDRREVARSQEWLRERGRRFGRKSGNWRGQRDCRDDDSKRGHEPTPISEMRTPNTAVLQVSSAAHCVCARTQRAAPGTPTPPPAQVKSSRNRRRTPPPLCPHPRASASASAGRRS
jgi:hypothetical protein